MIISTVSDWLNALRQAGIANPVLASSDLRNTLFDYSRSYSLGFVTDMNMMCSPEILHSLPPAEGQLNLIGYSYGGILAAHTAHTYTHTTGSSVDNLVLIGTPVGKEFYEALRTNPGIKNIIVRDLTDEGDLLHVGMEGGSDLIGKIFTIATDSSGANNTGHYYYNGNDAEGEARRRDFAQELAEQGLH